MSKQQENERLNTPITNAETEAESRAKAMSEQEEEELALLAADLQQTQNISE